MGTWEFPFMRRASALLAEVICEVRDQVRPGVTTAELDALAEEEIKKRGATPAFKGYRPLPTMSPFPGAICSSPNHEVVHGFPREEPLSEGDVVSLDFGLVYHGYYADSAFTVSVGPADPRVQALLDATREALEKGIAAARPGNRTGDIGHAIQQHVESEGFGLVYEFVGHGIGRKLHERPAIPNFGKPGAGSLLKPGMAICIEPMLTLGAGETRTLDDGWTAVTADGSLAAHFEHTILITQNGPEVLTRAA